MVASLDTIVDFDNSFKHFVNDVDLVVGVNFPIDTDFVELIVVDTWI